MVTLVELKTVANYIGLSTDEKPEQISDAAGMPNGSRFLEMDTGTKYFWNVDNMEWVALPESSDGGGGSWGEVPGAEIEILVTGTKFDGSILTDGKIVIINGMVNIKDAGNIFGVTYYISQAMKIKNLPKPVGPVNQKRFDAWAVAGDPTSPWIESTVVVSKNGVTTISLKTSEVWPEAIPTVSSIRLPTIVYVRADALG